MFRLFRGGCFQWSGWSVPLGMVRAAAGGHLPRQPNTGNPRRGLNPAPARLPARPENLRNPVGPALSPEIAPGSKKAPLESRTANRQGAFRLPVRCPIRVPSGAAGGIRPLPPPLIATEVGVEWDGWKVAFFLGGGYFETMRHRERAEDERWMRVALRQARKGLGLTSPNPAVGAVLVKGGKLLSQGWHRRAGGPHAEVEALRGLGDTGAATGATLYVTLEPCCTHGRTPPCTAAILQAGIARVVVGAVDPNPLHAGRGLEVLQAAGVEVRAQVLDAECAELNRGFFRWITSKRPWVTLKLAVSMDGRISRPPGESRWLSGAEAVRDAHRLRRESDAILIGAGTLRADDPALTVRHGMGRDKAQPWRVVVTRGGRLPERAQVFTDEARGRTLVYQGKPWEVVLGELGERYGVQRLLVEGGAEVAGELLEGGWVDEVCFYWTPRICGGGPLGVAGLGAGGLGEALRLEEPEYRVLGRDLRMRGRVVRGKSGPERA
jgi:diaminohydroxyphosphoribosylaminopyrimidine deaminase/5-amino-6-(5-phosphoribosylamino)uracil reductase